MNKKIDLQLTPFQPVDPELPILNLDTATSLYFNKKQTEFQRQLQSMPIPQLTGIRNTQLQEQLKKQIRAFLNVSTEISNQNIVFGFGTYSIMERLAWKYFKPGLMIGEFPQFRYFPMEYIMAGGKYQGYWNQDFSFPEKQLTEAIAKQTKLQIIFINNPNNPTGIQYPREQILNIIEQANKKNITVIVDEVYGDLLPVSYSMAALVNKYQNLYVLRSFSKNLGLQNSRVGYMISNKKNIQAYQAVTNWDEITNINALLALFILQDNAYLDQTRQLNRVMKEQTIDILSDNNYEIISSDLDVPLIFIQAKIDVDLAEELRQKNIKVEGSAAYQTLMSDFPVNYARIRVPLEQESLKILSERLCK